MIKTPKIGETYITNETASIYVMSDMTGENLTPVNDIKNKKATLMRIKEYDNSDALLGFKLESEDGECTRTLYGSEDNLFWLYADELDELSTEEA